MSTTHNLTSIKPSLNKLQAIERELTSTLIERDEVIRASLVALLAEQHLVVLGPPGTAKSALVIELSRRISPQNGAGLRNFAYLMTRFTTPEELFGPVSVAGLKRDEYRRITTGKLVEAELVFLDEIFKASSAILNATDLEGDAGEEPEFPVLWAVPEGKAASSWGKIVELS
jgi:MoxR-like ATPase